MAAKPALNLIVLSRIGRYLLDAKMVRVFARTGPSREYWIPGFAANGYAGGIRFHSSSNRFQSHRKDHVVGSALRGSVDCQDRVHEIAERTEDGRDVADSVVYQNGFVIKANHGTVVIGEPIQVEADRVVTLVGGHRKPRETIGDQCVVENGIAEHGVRQRLQILRGEIWEQATRAKVNIRPTVRKNELFV